MRRRDVIWGLSASLGAMACTPASRLLAGGGGRRRQIHAELDRLEHRSGGRLGVAIHDLETDQRIRHRATERFPMCSPFKVLACGAVLTKAGRGEERLERSVVFQSDDLVDYSPVTAERTGNSGMTVAELCQAALTKSDNTAGNLLLESLGGSQGVTAFARSLGDRVTRLDRMETALNEGRTGDPRDTTSPAAMAADLHALVIGNQLKPVFRQRLINWLVANTTGDTRIRAGLPRHWKVGDKTGAGPNGTTNDVAVAWPPNRQPIVLSVYMTGAKGSMESRDAIVAEVARAAVLGLSGETFL